MSNKTVVVDTNILVRYLLKDDLHQNAIACQYLDNKEINCIVPIMVFCEIDWVLRKSVKIPRLEVINFFEKLIQKPNVIFDKEFFDIGLYFLENGGDFADGVIAYQTTQFNNAKLLTFDKKSQKIAEQLNIDIQNL